MLAIENISALIGKTPLLRLDPEKWGFKGDILLKMESFNPGGSVKDRLALAMISDAFNNGIINNDSLIIEPSSGNTGVGLAMICAAKGLKLIITMPESMSLERRNLIKAYGAELVLTPAEKGMKGAIAKAEEIAAENENSFIPMQFENLANAEIHRKTTGPEIWNDTNGNIDVFVAGVGTGGTITGVGEFLKSQNQNIKIIAVEPKDSPVLSGGQHNPHKIQGIGAGFVPPVLNTAVYDEIICVSNQDAIETARKLAKEDGILCGISSGANVYAAVSYMKKYGNKDLRLVTIICDTGERYLSTVLFNNQ